MTFDKFNVGYVSLLDITRLPQTAASKALNMMQTQDGLWSNKWGSQYYTTAGSANIDGAGEYRRSDTGLTELIEGIGGNLYKSTNGGTKTLLTNGSNVYTAGKPFFTLQIANYLYIATGVDNLIRYDGTQVVLYTPLSTPGGLALAKAGLSGTNYNYYYQVCAVNAVGNSLPCPEQSIAVGKTRNSWTNGTDSISLTWNAVTGAIRYNIYISDASGYEQYLDSVSTTSYTDTGQVAINTFVTVPTDNTSQGPKFTQMELSGNRIWATGDPTNPWRVYWSGTGQNQGIFSQFSGGGWIDLEKGGTQRPSGVVHYRDGKGTAYADVMTSDVEGNGSTWTISLDSVTIGTTTFLVPTATKIVGSVGAAAPRGIVKVKNDIHFANNKGAQSLGSVPQLLNVLATNELSVNIRPDWLNLAGAYISGIAGYYYQGRVFWAVPYAASTNSQIWIYDTEKRNWQVGWTGVSIKQFLEYTDTGGVTHFLGVPVSGTRLIEFSPNVQGDLGAAYNTDLQTGLISMAPDHTTFAQITFAYIEIGRLIGTVTFEMLGTNKKGVYSSINSIDITGTTSSKAGWSSFSWSSHQWSDTSVAPGTTAQATITKRLRIQKLLNNFLLRVSSSGIDSQYTVLRFQVKGYMVLTNDPNVWISGVVQHHG